MADSDRLHFPLAEDESRRLAALHQLGILDTPREDDFDLLTELAAELCGTPYAFVVLIDADRIWVKSAFGMGLQDSSLQRGASPCAYVVAQQPMLVIEDVDLDPRTRNMPHAHFQMYAGAQLRTSDGLALGTLCVEDSRVRRPSEKQLELLQRLAQQVMQLIELRAAKRELLHQASTDALTGLANRRALFQRLQQELARNSRHHFALSFVVIDIDHFKTVNDRYGHATGDVVLQQVAECLRLHSRETDLIARFGGEEFCAILIDSDLEMAVQWADRTRVALHNMQINGFPQLRISASFGVTSVSKGQDHTPDTLFSAADKAVYRAKQAGRDRVESG
ncbi:GGDEF domain-containing protein [Pseudomarimonas arenosa]|uniref:diguanylate cyclase n=1 Tax=Pseudomarimonas arenosa TaxID=2774145 RepID=A0AAW3ZNH7_9GAMM|nr:sensor domain-containing diguanylate cyclase [Pseudomarimonas arenosa]MBD8526480.1 sensor domain-containing diguanylate cyclase [Pseudomarimonas arenosa]